MSFLAPPLPPSPPPLSPRVKEEEGGGGSRAGEEGVLGPDDSAVLRLGDLLHRTPSHANCQQLDVGSDWTNCQQVDVVLHEGSAWVAGCDLSGCSKIPDAGSARLEEMPQQQVRPLGCDSLKKEWRGDEASAGGVEEMPRREYGALDGAGDKRTATEVRCECASPQLFFPNRRGRLSQRRCTFCHTCGGKL